MLLEPYYWVCACVCSGVTCVYCRALRTPLISSLHNNKTGFLTRGEAAAAAARSKSHPLAAAREDKHNLEGTMKARGVLIFNVRAGIDLTIREYNGEAVE